MKRTFIILASLLTLAFTGCIEDTFAPDSLQTPESVTPSNLQYATLSGAREYAGFNTNAPTVDTDNAIPTFEIVGGRDQYGELTAEQLAFVTVENPTQSTYTVETTGDIVTMWTYTYAGRLTVGTGHQFYWDHNYELDIKVTTELDGVNYSTTFTGGFKFTVIPSMPAAANMMYLPLAQNLNTTESGDKTTSPSFSSFGDNLSFALTEEWDAIFDIDNATGEISLDASYVYGGEVEILNPSVVLTNTLSGETVEMTGGSSLITIYISDTDITSEMPQQKKYFFTPAFNSATSGDFKSVIYTEGNYSSNWISTNSTFATASYCYTLYPVSELGNPTTRYSSMTVGSTAAIAHESWFFLSGQDLTAFNLGFDLSLVYYLGNQYVEYKEDGTSPSILEGFYSTDFDQFTSDSPDTSSATWYPIDGSDGRTTFKTYTTGGVSVDVVDDDGNYYQPYPGTNTLYTAGEELISIKNTSYAWEHSKTLEVNMNLNDFADETNFCVAFRLTTTDTSGAPVGVNFGVGRVGNYGVSGLYMLAEEQAPEN